MIAALSRTTLLAVLASTVLACSSTAVPAGSGDSPPPPSEVDIVLSNTDCAPQPASVPAGQITFNVRNESGDAVSEVELMQGDTVVGEQENLAPGLSGSFVRDLEPGSYTIYCPGATTERSSFEVREP